MNKKTINVTLVLLAVSFTLACSCLPLSALEEYIETEQPVEQPQLTNTPDTERIEPSMTCSDELADLLWKAGEYDVRGDELPMGYTLVTYKVSGDMITSPDFPWVPKNLQTDQENASQNQDIWDFIVEVIPMDYRNRVAYFMIFTDGPGGWLGAVEQTDNPDEWILEVDFRDAANFPDLSTTLIHEVCHIFTLNTSQVATDYAVFEHPEDEEAYHQGDAACDTYYMFEGCSYPQSYINIFFERFWGGVYDQWAEANTEWDENRLEDLLYELYNQYPDQFVSTYAVTSPEEDIAESFMYFVLAPQPAGDTIAEQKILFFYEFPELVTLRDVIRTNLCPYVMP